MFPGWRRTKSASSFSHSGPDRKMDQVISQLTSKQIPVIVESVSRSDTPTNSPTKPATRADSVSPVRNKPPSPHLSSRDKQTRKHRSQTGPISVSPNHLTSGPPSRTQSDLPHLPEALHPTQHHTTQLQSVSSSSGILSSGSIFSGYGDSISSVATSGSEQTQPIHSDLDQAITRHEAKSPQSRPTNLVIPPSRRGISAKTPSPHKPDLSLKSPHKLNLFWSQQQQQIGSMSYNEKFTRPVTETVEEFTDPTLVTVPSHVILTSPAGNQLLPNHILTHLKQTSSIDSLASSTVNIITSITEEMQDLIGNSSATSVGDSSSDTPWVQNQAPRESINLTKQSWGSGSMSRMLDFCYSYLEDEVVVTSNSSPASPVTPQANVPQLNHHPLKRSRALSTPEERNVSLERSNPLSTAPLIPESTSRDLFLLTSNIIPVPTDSYPSPLIPPASKHSLQRLHSLPSRNLHSSSAGSTSTTNTFTEPSGTPCTLKEELAETDNAFEQKSCTVELRHRIPCPDTKMRVFRRKSSSFSSIASEIPMLEENQNSESIFYPRTSDRRKSSLERLESLEGPLRENLAFKAELRKYVIMNLVDTEMSYVRSLEAIIKDNGERLTMQIQLHNPLLLPALESLLSHLTLMLKKHQSFLSRIESAYKNYNQMTTVGGIIWQHFSQPVLLDTYLKYIQCYQALIDTLRITCNKTPNRQKKNSNPKDPFEKLTLADLLIKPIQRPSRYPLIIKDLQKQSIPGSSEYQQLANAMLQVGNFTMKMNAFLKNDVPSGPEVLKELESMIDGLENLTKPNRVLLRLRGDFVTETKSPNYFLSPRRDKCIFLFSDLIILCSSRPKSGSLVRASSFSGEPNFDLAKRKLKLIWEIPLHKVTIENCDSPVDREKTKADKHLEKLLEDEKRMSEMLTQMQDLNYGNNNLERVLADSLHILQGQIYDKRSKLPSFSSYLTLVDLEQSERRIIVFADEQTKLDWVKAFKEAKRKIDSEHLELSWSVDRKENLSLPNFLNPLMLMESRSGMEATCACQVETTHSDITTLWVCRSDKFGGQVVELVSQNGALPRVNASYTVSASPILCLTSVPETSGDMSTMNEESDPSSVILQEETPRIRPYNYRSASERRCVYARYTRPTSGRYSAASSFADSFLDSATLSKCSSTSNLSDISSSTRDRRMSAMDQLDASFSNSQWDDSPLYIETSRRAGDLISMVSGSVTSLDTTSDYEQSIQSLMEECSRTSNHWVNSSLQESVGITPPFCKSISEESLVLPKNLMKQITQLDEMESGTHVVNSKYERFGVKMTSPEVTDKCTDSNNSVRKLIQQFSPEKNRSNKVEDTENENFGDDTPVNDTNSGSQSKTDDTSSESQSKTDDTSSESQSKTPLPSETPSSTSPAISPDISHLRQNSRELNRLWLQSSFNKSNPHIEKCLDLPLTQPALLIQHLKTNKDTSSLPATPLDVPDCKTEDKKGKVEKKSSFNKLQIPKIFSHITRNSSPRNREIPPFKSSHSPPPQVSNNQDNLALTESQQLDQSRAGSRNKFRVEGPTVWLGTESGGLVVFQSDANIRTQSKHTIKLSHPASSICYHRSKVFVGLGNGYLIIFSYSKGSHEWVQSEKRQVSPIDHRLTCITSVQQETLWVAEANRVHVFAGDVFKFPVKKFSLWPKQRNSSLIIISHIVFDGNEGVWVCLDREPTLHLYSILTYSQILQVDCIEPSLRLIKDKILYKHMSDQFRISSVHAAAEGTWVGTSAGILAFISTPKYNARDCQVTEPPAIYPSYHGHTAGVKFIVPWKHKFLESKTREIFVTGGIGYEYRGNTKYPVEFERDVHNSGTVLIWSP